MVFLESFTNYVDGRPNVDAALATLRSDIRLKRVVRVRYIICYKAHALHVLNVREDMTISKLMQSFHQTSTVC